MYPILPCPDVDEAIAFYESLGFTRTYRQLRPNPHAVVALGELAIHLSGIPAFDPAGSYASVIVVVPDPDDLYRAFAAGLRRTAGCRCRASPGITRPRKRYGTVAGFSLIDVGGNWLRVQRAGDTEESADGADAGLGRIVEVAARLGDSHGDGHGRAQELWRVACGASPRLRPVDRARALLFRAELAVRVGDLALARSSLAEMREIELGEDERTQVEEEVDHRHPARRERLTQFWCVAGLSPGPRGARDSPGGRRAASLARPARRRRPG